MNENPTRNGLAVAVSRLVLVALFGAAITGMAAGNQKGLDDAQGLNALWIRADTVTIQRRGVVRNEFVKQTAELPAVPEKVNALLVSGAGIDDCVIVRVDDLGGLALLVNAPLDPEKKTAQNGLLLSSQPEVVGDKPESESDGRANQSGEEIGSRVIHWILVAFALGFLIYEITWSKWFMNWTDRLYDKVSPENDEAHAPLTGGGGCSEKKEELP